MTNLLLACGLRIWANIKRCRQLLITHETALGQISYSPTPDIFGSRLMSFVKFQSNLTATLTELLKNARFYRAYTIVSVYPVSNS